MVSFVQEPSQDLSFHHLGLACESIYASGKTMKLVGYAPEGPVFEDENQGVRGQFYVSNNGPRFELLENLPGRSTLTPWLRRSAPMYHSAYIAKNFEESVEMLIGSGSKMLVNPTPAIAFEGRMICFLFLPTRALIEIIED